jgi:hypothetical protein
LIVNSRCRPSGSAAGQRWDTSPFDASGTVRVSTVPPFSPTRINPAVAAEENTIPFSVQTAPFEPPALAFSAMRVGSPPATETL